MKLVLCLLICLSALGQTPPKEENYQFHIKKAAPVKLDGILDDAAWINAQTAKDFFLNQPFDSAFANNKTEVKLSYDDQNIYVGARIYQPRKEYTVSSMKRDFAGSTSDVFVVNFDTFSDGLNAFHFAVSPLNIQREGLLSPAQQGPLIFWDNVWYSEVKNHSEYWELEMAIPFKTLRYNVSNGQNVWRMNIGRNFIQAREISTWRPVPRNFPPSNTIYMGQLIWDQAPPKPGGNVSLIPYLSAGTQSTTTRNTETLATVEKTSDLTKGIGLDAKVAVTSSLNLDLTINPDFSQVEVDRQVTNLSRFELFFPERRQFFLENSDLFGIFGFPDTRPFFSRRIGIGRNPLTNASTQVPILAGARLSGKLGKDLRVGLMNMQTRNLDFGEDAVLPGANYSVLTLQQKVFSRSSIGAILTNKQTLMGRLSENQRGNFKPFNRVGGVEFNYNAKNGRFDTETYIHGSASPNGLKDATSMAHYMGYHHPNADLNLGLMRIGEGFEADMGFVPRTGIYQIYRPIILVKNPKNKKIATRMNAFGLGSQGSDVFDLKGDRLDSETSIFLFGNSPGNGEVSLGYNWNFTHLFYAFDPTNAAINPNPNAYKNVVSLPIDDYRWRYISATAQTSNRQNLQWKGSWFQGGFFNGTSILTQTTLSYRLQPIGLFSIDANYTSIELPKPYNSVKYWLLGPKAELSFSRNLFFSTFFQYNTQTNNTNINSRLQWRFKPVSDLYLVYTDNYFAQTIDGFPVAAWAPKNRALVLKISYWFNV